MKKLSKKQLGAEVTGLLKEIYPDAECALNYGGDPWKLLVMARLSAQCTDARVNLVCQTLFKQLPTAEALPHEGEGLKGNVASAVDRFRRYCAERHERPALAFGRRAQNSEPHSRRPLSPAGNSSRYTLYKNMRTTRLLPRIAFRPRQGRTRISESNRAERAVGLLPQDRPFRA